MKKPGTQRIFPSNALAEGYILLAFIEPVHNEKDFAFYHYTAVVNKYCHKQT